MRGVSATTGAALDGVQHLAQSIGCILTTPVGSRVMRRDFGSLLPQLVDQPYNAATRIRLFAATASALMRWEPRLRLTRVAIAQAGSPGAVDVTIEGVRTDTPSAQPTTLTVPLQLSAA
ncbi:MAG: GPW/gp25 family protein [Rhodanobacter sp.]